MIQIDPNTKDLRNAIAGACELGVAGKWQCPTCKRWAYIYMSKIWGDNMSEAGITAYAKMRHKQFSAWCPDTDMTGEPRIIGSVRKLVGNAQSNAASGTPCYQLRALPGASNQP